MARCTLWTSLFQLEGAGKLSVDCEAIILIIVGDLIIIETETSIVHEEGEENAPKYRKGGDFLESLLRRFFVEFLIEITCCAIVAMGVGRLGNGAVILIEYTINIRLESENGQHQDNGEKSAYYG